MLTKRDVFWNKDIKVEIMQPCAHKQYLYEKWIVGSSALNK